MDESGCILSSVLVFLQSLKKVLTSTFLSDKFSTVMNDGLVISGAVDIYCDDISYSKLLTIEY